MNDFGLFATFYIDDIDLGSFKVKKSNESIERPLWNILVFKMK